MSEKRRQETNKHNGNSVSTMGPSALLPDHLYDKLVSTGARLSNLDRFKAPAKSKQAWLLPLGTIRFALRVLRYRRTCLRSAIATGAGPMVCYRGFQLCAAVALCGWLGASRPRDERGSRAWSPDSICRACSATEPMAVQLHALWLDDERQRQRHRPRPHRRYRRELL